MKNLTTNPYARKQERDNEATVGGIFFLVVPILFTFFCFLSGVQVEGIEVFTSIMVVGATILRIVAAVWISRKATELNRNSASWIAFAAILPGIALTVISLKNKIVAPDAWKQHLYNYNKAEVFRMQTNIFPAAKSLQMAS